ncbi:hypothetical protein FRC0036_00810 [Corynebacterium diphtheriae]|nr:hypothetical protein CIP100294_00628 [Corynebacterium diphtheriae]CAB0498979.1 hypothetical protein CIP102550_00685 [Corynebacterium diphtheriae]CAB0499045.1 hypothetical protein CIP100161_00667 [Corynebacterium diphtheriae]CAB0500278.1 hypothetical protein CIP107506_00781 [Corynebacterium diphtheriae]CAB0524468.1 hypothetical protein CIP100275_01998 [Corynebacterium diphtheriae]
MKLGQSAFPIETPQVLAGFVGRVLGWFLLKW